MMKKLFLLLPVFALATLLLSTTADADTQRPNFLFVIADDQRYDQLGVVQREQGDKGRYPWFTTPNMDRLAEDGVRFRNAFVTSSLCSPSRAAYLTGRYPHLNGIASNFREMPLDTVTHATLLKAAGYTTAYIGKWHMFNQRQLPPCFDYQATLIGHGRYNNCPLIIQGVETPTRGWVDDVTTDYAIEFIEKQKGTGKPWSMVLGFKAPHSPFVPPARAENRFMGEKARAVPNLFSHAPYKQKMGAPFDPPVEENGLVTTNLNHARCVSACDDNLGRLLDALDQFGFAENTIVIYTSDNGYYDREHGVGDKRDAYEISLRVPFLVRFPKLGNVSKGLVVDEPILNIDLAPTLLDYAGVPIPKEMQGKSWRPLLEGKKPADWRKAWFYEYFAEDQRPWCVTDVTAVRSLDTKLIKYAIKSGELSDWTEMYDLANDPYELKNLYNDPAHAERQQEIEREYARLRKEVEYTIPDFVHRPEWWDKGNGLPTAEDIQAERQRLLERAAASN
jgi:arylsulfatase A-like enzyme